MAKKVKYKDKIIEILTVSELAKIVGKSRDTILRYERTGVFPIAPFRVDNKRFYPKPLCNDLIPLVGRIPSHTKPSADLVTEINATFKKYL